MLHPPVRRRLALCLALRMPSRGAQRGAGAGGCSPCDLLRGFLFCVVERGLGHTGRLRGGGFHLLASPSGVPRGVLDVLRVLGRDNHSSVERFRLEAAQPWGLSSDCGSGGLGGSLGEKGLRENLGGARGTHHLNGALQRTAERELLEGILAL